MASRSWGAVFLVLRVGRKGPAGTGSMGGHKKAFH